MADQWKQEPFVPFEMPKPPPGSVGSPEANLAGALGFAAGYAAVTGAFRARQDVDPSFGQPRKNVVDSFFDGMSELGLGILLLVGVVFLVLSWKVVLLVAAPVALLVCAYWPRKKGSAAPSKLPDRR